MKPELRVRIRVLLIVLAIATIGLLAQGPILRILRERREREEATIQALPDEHTQIPEH